jgi:hypothetical protein
MTCSHLLKNIGKASNRSCSCVSVGASTGAEIGTVGNELFDSEDKTVALAELSGTSHGGEIEYGSVLIIFWTSALEGAVQLDKRAMRHK